MRLQPTNVEAYSSLARVVSYEALSPLVRRLVGRVSDGAPFSRSIEGEIHGRHK